MKSPENSPKKPINSSLKIENNLRGADDPLEDDFKQICKSNEATSRDTNTIPRLDLGENSHYFHHNSKKIERDGGYQKFGTNSPNYEKKSKNDEKTTESVQSNPDQGQLLVENAALTIQRYYRGYRTRMEAGYSAVQKALDERRAIVERQKKVDE